VIRKMKDYLNQLIANNNLVILRGVEIIFDLIENDVNLEQSVTVKLKYWMNDEFQDFLKQMKLVISNNSVPPWRCESSELSNWCTLIVSYRLILFGIRIITRHHSQYKKYFTLYFVLNRMAVL